jgi:benzoate-CoA ligase
VAVPLDAAADPEALADPIEDCAAAVLVAPAATRGAPGPLLTPAELAAGPRRDVAPVRDGDLAYLVYSSGSTGRPKAAMHSHGDLRVGIETYAAEVLALGPGDRCHSASRLHPSLGFGNGFVRVLGRGATAVLNGRRPAPGTILGLLERHRVTVLTAVPTLWAQLARYAARRPDETGGLAGLRLAVSSGDGLSATVAAAVRESLGVELLQGLGCSECSNVVISMRPGERADGALGRPVTGIDVALRDEDGAPVAAGEPGRLWIRSASNTTGYWGRPDLTRDLLHGEWIRMGDMLVEREGRLHHMGRADALFKVDGRFVSPPAVEEALLGHPAVAEAAVVGRSDDRGLVRAMAAVVVEGAPPDDLAEDLRRRVADAVGPHAVPRTIEVMDELPRLSSGKLDRRALAERAG